MFFFDQTSVGRTTRPVVLTVEEQDVLRFASVIGETNPVHKDPKAARAAGYAGLVAPPIFAAVLVELAGEQLRKSGEPDIVAIVAGENRELVHGLETFGFHAPIVAGQLVEVTARVTGIDVAGDRLIQRARLEISVNALDAGPLVTISRVILQVVPE